ncbi:MAG: M48 family metallopeptidase [Terriglobales bacterium]
MSRLLPEFRLNATTCLTAVLALLLLPGLVKAQQAQSQPQGNPQAMVDGIPVANEKTAKKLKALDNVYMIGHRDVSKGLNFYSDQKALALGQQLAHEVMQNSKVITDPVVNEYINRLAQNLVRNSDANNVLFHVHVLQDDTVNAFALPGGYFFVNSGVILACNEEDELAGVMAHEIAHVAARHMTKKITEGDLLSLLTIPAEILAGPGLGGLGAEVGANAIVPWQMEKFSRGDEQEADWLGTQYLWKAGYDPYGLPRAFELIEAEEKQKPGLISRMYASHPATSHRIAITEREIQTILPPRPAYVVTTSDFNLVQARLRALLRSRYETGISVPGGIPEPHAVPKVAGPPIIKH